MDNFKKWKFDLTPEAAAAVIDGACDHCPAAANCEEESWMDMPDCKARFILWAEKEAE